jgi:hypothetical protein
MRSPAPAPDARPVRCGPGGRAGSTRSWRRAPTGGRRGWFPRIPRGCRHRGRSKAISSVLFLNTAAIKSITFFRYSFWVFGCYPSSKNFYLQLI